MWSLLRKIWRDITRRRVRSALTILGIAVGVAGLVAITSTARNLTRAQRALFDANSQADLSYWVWDAPPNLMPLLEADERIAKAELRTTYLTRYHVGRVWRDIELIGIDRFGDVRINQFEIVAGRAPQPGEMLLDESASEEGALRPGDEIAIRAEGGRERYLILSGISRSPSHLSSSITNTAIGYVPASQVRRSLGISGSNQLLIRLADARDSQAVIGQVQRLARRQQLQIGAPIMRDPDNYPGKRELDALIVIMLLFSIMGLVLSSVLVANTLSASVAEQIGEIGILKTLGASERQVLGIYLVEALAQGILGTLLGVGLGALLGWRLLAWIASLGNATVAFSLAPEGLILGAFTGIMISLLGGLVPALRGARMGIHEALASYGIRSDYGQGWTARQLERLSVLPPLSAMAVRNLSRRPSRSLLTLLVVVLASASFLGALSTRDAVVSAISDVYVTYASDAWVWLGQRVSTRFADHLTTLPGVRGAEGWALANGVVGLGEARLWGIPHDSPLYRQVMREGRWYQRDEPEAVVLSSELADAQNLKVGQSVEVQVRDTRRSFRVVGIAIDNTIFLGGELEGKAFVSREALNRLLGSQDRVSFFALALASRDPQIADEILAGVETKFAPLRPVVQPVYAEIEAAEEGSRLLTIALAAMLIIVSLVGSLGVLNTLTLNVLERRQEIAVIRAVGGTDQAIVLAFLAEGASLGLAGWALGVLVGYPAGYLFTRQLGQVLFTLDYAVKGSALILSLGFTLCLAIGASLGPAIAAAHFPVSAAIRYE